MISRQKKYAEKILSVDEAVRKVKNGDRVFLGSVCTEPKSFVKSLGSSSVEDVELIQFIPGNASAELAKIPGKRFTLKTFFMGRRARGGDSF